MRHCLAHDFHVYIYTHIFCVLVVEDLVIFLGERAIIKGVILAQILLGLWAQNL